MRGGFGLGCGLGGINDGRRNTGRAEKAAWKEFNNPGGSLMKEVLSTKTRIVVSDPDHPHYLRTGFFTGKIISLFGKPMAEVRFDDGTDDGCFIQKGQAEETER